MNETVKLPSGAVIPKITPEEADRRCYLSQSMLDLMHLSPVGAPVACSGEEDALIYYYDPARVTETAPELWYRPMMEEHEPVDVIELESGTEVEKLSTKRAAAMGFYTRERLDQMNYDVTAEPVAYNTRSDGSMIYFYDKRTAVRRPLKCVVCGKDVRYKRKMCRACFEADLAIRRAEGDAHRAQSFGMQRERVLFFDLELTGVYDHDEIISVSITNANGEVLMDTLVKPLRKKKWNRTEKIHGISPAMVQDAPTLDELIPTIKEMFANADNLIAFGVSTDYSHIKYIYETEREQEALHKKTRCCALEFVRFQSEHYPEDRHASLVDAMRTLGIGWDGIPHSSIADTIACMKVWEALFPNYYTTPMPELPDYSAMTPAAAPAFNEATGEYVHADTSAATAEAMDATDEKEEAYV